MSNYSEKILQRSLHDLGYYTQKAPSSGVGIADRESGEHIDQADIVAIQEFDVVQDNWGNTASRIQVLVIEEKHTEPDRCTIQDHEKEALERIEEITGGSAFFAVKWRSTQDDHRLFRPAELQDTGKHWKITRDQDGVTVDEI